jgi:hypothetical protein
MGDRRRPFRLLDASGVNLAPAVSWCYFESTSDASGYHTLPQLGCLHSKW